MTMISEAAMLSELAAEFPGYEFSTQRTWDGVSLIAVRQKGPARSGLYVVITPDRDEMRRTLLEDAELEGPGPEGTGAGDRASGGLGCARPRTASVVASSRGSLSPDRGCSDPRYLLRVIRDDAP